MRGHCLRDDDFSCCLARLSAGPGFMLGGMNEPVSAIRRDVSDSKFVYLTYEHDM